MPNRRLFIRGIIVGCLAMLAADALIWMLTPTAHPGAGALHRILVAVQAVVGIVGALVVARTNGRQTTQKTPIAATAPRATRETTAVALADEVGDTALVVEDYQVHLERSIQLHVGDEVHVAREDDEYPGWWWCTDGDGKSGWIPADRLAPSSADRIAAGARARARNAYDFTELPVERGQVVMIKSKRRNWLLVGNGTGALGWIPTSHVDRLPHSLS